MFENNAGISSEDAPYERRPKSATTKIIVKYRILFLEDRWLTKIDFSSISLGSVSNILPEILISESGLAVRNLKQKRMLLSQYFRNDKRMFSVVLTLWSTIMILKQEAREGFSVKNVLSVTKGLQWDTKAILFVDYQTKVFVKKCNKRLVCIKKKIKTTHPPFTKLNK